MPSCCSCQTPVAKPKLLVSILIFALILTIYLLLERTSLFSLVSVNSNSSLLLFFLFGLLAGFSTCSATIGALVVGLTRQGTNKLSQFHLGRFIAFAIFGALLGQFGSFFQLSPDISALINIFVALFLLYLAITMLLPSVLPRLKFLSLSTLPQSSFILGLATFFVPCGFTLTAQSLALTSGQAVSGGLIMTSFALGTFIPLLLISFLQAKSLQNPIFSSYFSQVTGLLLFFFALYLLYSQSIVLGLTSFSSSTSQADRIPQTVLRMDATGTGYSPNRFTIKAGQPIRWEITDRGTSGCTNAVIARKLFTGSINLVPGTTSVKEFIAPTTPGTYRFSCWMGMISGTIEVVN